MTKDEYKEKERRNPGVRDSRSLHDLTHSELLVQNERLPRIQYYRLYLSNLFNHRTDILKASVSRELEIGLAFNLFPVFLAVGIGIYFAAPAEPFFTAILLATATLCIFAMRIANHGRLFYALALFASVFGGMLVAKISTIHSFTPLIERQMTSKITGLVLNVDSNKRGAPRLMLRPLSIEGLKQSELPRRIRLSTASKDGKFEVGTTVHGLARIQPFAGPVMPGSYDFSFHGWFNGLGGSGFFMGSPDVLPINTKLTLTESLRVAINSTRNAINRRIGAAIPGMGGEIAIALITGDKTRIPADAQESLRKTGLAHILAISGLHMALVTLTLIWCVRFAFTMLPEVPLKYPVKKWAACVGFFGATIYLFLSGAGIATQRAWIMISVMLLAVLLDRRAITMRSVAVSATIILVLSPQSLFAPGFQMSFAAVASLVAGYEFLNKRKRDRPETVFVPKRQGLLGRLSSGVAGYVVGMTTTSLIAGTATTFIAVWHFHQIAPFGLLANVLAMPIVGFIIMPFALFSMILMPYGLEAIALAPVEQGIIWVVEISKWVETLSPSGVTGALPSGSLILFASALSILTLLRTRLRLFSFLPIVLIYPFLKVPEVPQVMVSENGRAIAVQDKKGELELLYPRRNAFTTGIWAKAFADGQIKSAGLSKDQCNSERCIVVLPSSLVMHIVYDPKLLRPSCQRADILIAPRLWWVNCRHRTPQLILKRYDFEQHGSHAIYIADSTQQSKLRYDIEIKTGLQNKKRPWSRKVRPIDEVNDIDEAIPQASPEPLHDQS